MRIKKAEKRKKAGCWGRKRKKDGLNCSPWNQIFRKFWEEVLFGQRFVGRTFELLKFIFFAKFTNITFAWKNRTLNRWKISASKSAHSPLTTMKPSPGETAYSAAERGGWFDMWSVSVGGLYWFHVISLALNFLFYGLMELMIFMPLLVLAIHWRSSVKSKFLFRPRLVRLLRFRLCILVQGRVVATRLRGPSFTSWLCCVTSFLDRAFVFCL